MDTTEPTETAHIQPIPCKNKEVYSELNTLIYEYLEVNGLEQALSTFTKECVSKNLPCPKLPDGNRDMKAAFTHYDGELLLKSFDQGELDTFLKLWKQFQTHIQVTSEDMKKLEVYLRVHFAIYPKAQRQPEAKQTQAMQSLKTFFEENSVSLSSDATILPLFALPFVADPRPHPIFKDLFHESWTSKLRAQLETTVNKYFELLQENITNHCKLASVVAKGSKTSAQPVPTAAAPVKAPVRKPSLSKQNTISNNTTSTSTVITAGGVSPTNKQPTVTNASAGSESTPAATGEVIPQSLLQMTESAILYHQDRFLQLLSIHRKTRKVLKGVRESYSKLLKVSSILITALERSLAANPTLSSGSGSTLPPSNLDLILQQCLLIYPEIFTNPSSEATPASSKPDLNHFKQLAAATSSTSSSVNANTANSTAADCPSTTTPDNSDVSLLFLGLPDISLETLHYSKIKEDLISEKLPATDRLCLLQALRWLITKTSPTLRASVMENFIDNDLLGLKSSTKSQNHSQKLFSCLLSTTPTYQKESLARLINAFASTWTGRTYLTATNLIIDTLIRSLFTFKTQEESFICHMVIATLQKLSLRQKMRQYMIDHLVIPWLVKYIKTELERDQIRSEVNQALSSHSKQQDSDAVDGNANNNNESSYGDTAFNTYLMEYAWALLMNLSLHPESIKSALTVDFEFLHCIMTMLTSRASFEFIPYVLSTLFSLLRNPNFFEKAKSMDLNKKLSPIITHQPPEIQHHLRHLLTQLYEKPNIDRLTATGETDYDDSDNPDPEEMEPELELQESWMVNQTMNEQMITGDDLLIREYILPKEMPLSYAPPTNKSRQTVNTSSSSDHPHGSLSNKKNDSVDSSFHSNKSSRENSSDPPPSNQKGSNGLILRPTTPTHTKSPRISRLDEYVKTGKPFGSRSRTPIRRSNSRPSPPLQSTPTIKPQNPFLHQFNSMRTNTINNLVLHSPLQSSSEQREGEEDEEEEELITTLAAKMVDDEEELYDELGLPHASDSVGTGRFSLHESPMISFKESPFIDKNLNFTTETD